MQESNSTSQIKNIIVSMLVSVLIFASILLPFYANFKQKKAIVTYRTVYSKLLLANRLYATLDSQEQGVYDTTISANDFAEMYFTPYLTIESFCKGDQSACWKKPPYKDLKNTKYFNKSMYSIVLDNNSVIGFHKEPKQNLMSIIVDTDGIKGQNKLGKDIFVFYFYNDKTRPTLCKDSVYKDKEIPNGIHFGGYDECGIPQDYYDYKKLYDKKFPDACSKKAEAGKYGLGVGAACGAMLYKNSWVMDNKYPW